MGSERIPQRELRLMSTQFGARPIMHGSKFFEQPRTVIVRLPPSPAQVNAIKADVIPEAYAAGYRDGFRDGQLVGPEVNTAGDRVAAICNDVCARFGITKAELTGRRHLPLHVDARRVAALRMAEELGMSLPQIGRILHKDHTTILHAIRRARGEETRRNKKPLPSVAVKPQSA